LGSIVPEMIEAGGCNPFKDNAQTHGWKDGLGTSRRPQTRIDPKPVTSDPLVPGRDLMEARREIDLHGLPTPYRRNTMAIDKHIKRPSTISILANSRESELPHGCTSIDRARLSVSLPKGRPGPTKRTPNCRMWSLFQSLCHFYTGFVNEAGTQIKGRAAKWCMADWLIEKLDEIVSHGLVDQAAELSPCHSQGGTLLEQEEERALVLMPSQDQGGTLLEQQEQAEILLLSPEDMQGGTLLEQEGDQDIEHLFDRDWIIAFRQSTASEIGLIWGGTVQDMRREAG
jgi:hypothetical protein